jgi:hypothetical protein
MDLIQMFLNKQLGKLVRGVFLQAQVLSANSSSISFPQHDPPIHKHLLHNLFLGCVKEYSWAACFLAPFSPTPTSSDNTSTLTTLHP